METNKIERQQSTKWDRNDYMRTVTERCCYVLKMFDSSVKLMRTQCRLIHTLRCETRQNENRNTKYSTNLSQRKYAELRCVVLYWAMGYAVLCCVVPCYDVLCWDVRSALALIVRKYKNIEHVHQQCTNSFCYNKNELGLHRARIASVWAAN